MNRRWEEIKLKEGREDLSIAIVLLARWALRQRSRQGCALMMHSISSPRRSHLFSLPWA